MTEPRYRLSPFVFARKHVSAGRPTVALFDKRRPGVFYPGAKGWAVLSALDGSRDLEGVRVAVAAQHPSLGEAELRVFVEDAVRHDLVALVPGTAVEEGAAAPTPATGSAEPTEPPVDARTPVVSLPAFELRCDGRGSCCRLYPSIVASPLEAANARSACPGVLEAGDDEARAFFPERGIDRRSLSIALVDGACAYLEPGGGCGVHARRGEAAKPLGCRTYPLTYVFDGDAVREVPVMECACVLASGLDPANAHAASTPRQLEARAHEARPPRAARDLDPRLIVERPPERFLVSAASGRYATLREIAAWCASIRVEGDAPSALFALAASVEAGELPSAGVPPGHATFEVGGTPLDRARIAARAEALERSAARRREELEPSGLALASVVLQAIEIACGVVRADLDALLEVGEEIAAAERFYLRGILFGLDLVGGRDDSLSDALFDRGFRLLVARGMAVAFALAEVTDPAVRYPIAVLNATVRGYGLATTA